MLLYTDDSIAQAKKSPASAGLNTLTLCKTIRN